MYNYISGSVEIRIIFLMLQNGLEIGSKRLYQDAMEARVLLQLDTIT